MAHFEFEVDAAEEEQQEKAPSFGLGGVQFQCISRPTMAAVKLISRVDGGSISCSEFIRAVLVAEDEEKWDGLLASKEVMVKGAKVIEIFNWLVEQYSGRPTKRPSRSRAGRSKTGDGLKATTSPTAAEAS